MTKGQQLVGNEQVGYTKPLIAYTNTKTNIEALTDVIEGAIAYATDTNELGSYNGSAWTWNGLATTHQHTAIILMATHALGGTVAAGATVYMCPYIDGLLTPTERAMPTSKAGTMRNLYFRLTGTQPSTGSLVITARKNNADTAIVITIPANGAAGTWTDLTHSVAMAAGDYVSFSIHNNASSASPGLGFCTIDVEYTTT